MRSAFRQTSLFTLLSPDFPATNPPGHGRNKSRAPTTPLMSRMCGLHWRGGKALTLLVFCQRDHVHAAGGTQPWFSYSIGLTDRLVQPSLLQTAEPCVGR